MRADIIFVIRNASLRGAAVDTLRRELRNLIAPGRRLILHMSGVENIDTQGAGAIVEVSRQLRAAGGALKLVGLEKKVEAFFELLRLTRTIEIHGSNSAALAMRAAA